MEKALEFFIACVTAAGFGIAIAAFGCGIAQGIGLRSAVEGIARNPESSGKVTVTMLIGLGSDRVAVYLCTRRCLDFDLCASPGSLYRRVVCEISRRCH